MQYGKHSLAITGFEDGERILELRQVHGVQQLRMAREPFPPRAYRKECDPVDTMNWAQRDPFWTPNLQKWNMIILCS